MHVRNPGYIDIERFAKAVRAMPEPQRMSLANRLLLSVGMIVAPVIVFVVILGVARLVAAL